MKVTLFSGYEGWVITVLAGIGALWAFDSIQAWLDARIELDLNPRTIWLPGWRAGKGFTSLRPHIHIPRRFKLRIRPDRPGANVILGDGRRGVILCVLRDDDLGEPIAAVQPYDEDEQLLDPEWVPADCLSPLPREAAA